MTFYRFLPQPSDRMGVLWALASINGACVLEYGPAGTTHFGIESYAKLNVDLAASLFTTHLDEEDVIMGDSGRLANTLLELDKSGEFQHIFVVGSSVSAVIGMDIKAVCNQVQSQCRAKLHCFVGGGLTGSYSLGIRQVLTTLATEVVVPTEAVDSNRYNIIGSTADCYNFASDIAEIERLMENCFGMRAHAVFTTASSIETIATASQSVFNLVLRAEGLEAAEVLKERYGQEYYYGIPYGYQGTQNWIRGVANAVGRPVNTAYLQSETQRQKDHLLRWRFLRRGRKELTAVVAGNFDLAVNLSRFLAHELDIKPTVVVVNHEKGAEHTVVEELFADVINFNPSEEEKENILVSCVPDVILSDGLLLKMYQQGRVRLQVSHPNLHKTLFTRHTPFVGFNGASHILEEVVNGLSIS